VEPELTSQALRDLVAQIVTLDRIEAALRSLPIERAARAIIEASLEGRTEPDELVTKLDVLSTGAQTLALVRRMVVGESMLVDPVEVADQARVGSGEFTRGWWRSAPVLLNRRASGSNCWRADSHARASRSR
jgi:hypothetical protein